jgi:cysteinyl-tRNA synthetase
MPAPVFYNTLQRKLVPLETIQEGKVSLYTCGPTVYNHAHIGNLRTFLFEDLLRRTLRFLGYRVTQVMNITDVDDNVIRKAGEAGATLDAYTAPYIESFLRDLDILNVEPAEHYPRATRHVPEMIEMIRQLIDKGFAYEADGSIFFRIAQDEDYGRLSGFDLSQVRQGERVADDNYGKEDVRDFVLWKGAKEGEPYWESPWGKGRPGWHIECSAMSMKYLGESFDIHCGGVDNIFPHHENEIAQSESATGREFVHTWLHADHLIVDGEKMSKSLGNQYTLGELLDRGCDPRVVRYLLLSVHYRKKLNFTFDGLHDAESALGRIDEMRFRLENSPEGEGEESSILGAVKALRTNFSAALADDLNISAALGALFILVKETNKAIEAGKLVAGDQKAIAEVLGEVDSVLGVLDPERWDPVADRGSEADAGITRLVEEREAARRNRDFKLADEIRDRLAAEGVTIEDTPQGARWKRR